MSCPVHAPATANADDSDDHRITPDVTRAPEVERVIREFFRRWKSAINPLANSLVKALLMGAIDLRSTSGIRADVRTQFGEFTNDLEIIFRTQSTDAAKAGRAVAKRRHNLDISFDIYEKRILDVLDRWPVTASQHVSDTIRDDVVHYLKGAQEEGLSIDEIANQFQEEFVKGRLKGWKAEQLARDSTVAPANGGHHTAYSDASNVLAEKWLAADDSRTRRTHNEADNQVVAVSQPFLVGGFPAAYPGDPSLPVWEFTNCRCSLGAVFEFQLTDSQVAEIKAGGRVWV